MENARVSSLEIEVGTPPEGVGTAGMKESAPTVPGLGHNIGERGGCLWGGAQVSGIDFVLAAIIEDLFPEGVFADKARRQERERSAGLREINQYIIRRSSGALGLTADIAQLFRLRININQLHLIDDPVASGQQATAVIRALDFHGTRRSVGR